MKTNKKHSKKSSAVSVSRGDSLFMSYEGWLEKEVKYMIDLNLKDLS